MSQIESMKISKEIFDEEVAMCRKLSGEKAGCNWGKCADCGVIPLLHKLHRGVLIEDKEELEKIKKEVFGK